MIKLNKTELQDIDYLMKKIIDGEPFYALEVSKANYLLKRIKELHKGNNVKLFCNNPLCFIQYLANHKIKGVQQNPQ